MPLAESQLAVNGQCRIVQPLGQGRMSVGTTVPVGADIPYVDSFRECHYPDSRDDFTIAIRHFHLSRRCERLRDHNRWGLAAAPTATVGRIRR